MKHRLALILPAYFVGYLACYWIAFQLRFDFDLEVAYTLLFTATLPLVMVVKLSACLASREWERAFRHTTANDIVHLSVCNAAASGALWLFNYLLPMPIPRSVIGIDLICSVVAGACLRMSYRLYQEMLHPKLFPVLRPRTLVFGVQAPSIGLLKLLETTTSSEKPFRVVGFVDDESAIHARIISGLPVYRTETGWVKIRERSRARHLLIPGSISGQQVRKLFHDCKAQQIKVSVIPTVEELVDGRVKLAARDVDVSDLLRREPNRLDMESIQEYVTGKRVMVTGGAGSIGSELCRQILALNPATLTVYDQSEFGVFSIEQEFAAKPEPPENVRYVVADILDQDRIHQVLEEARPEIMFHAAAYKHVPLMEDNPQAAVINNVLGTKTVAEAASKHGVERFVLISTDKAVRPTSVMGATKLLAEKCVQSLARHSQTRFITVRFGNVLNSMGSVVPTFRRQIEAGGPVTVTHPDMKRFFMTIPEAVQLVLQAGAIGTSGDVLILDMGEPVKISDLAKDMIELSGLRYPEDVDIVYTGMRPGEKLYEELFYDGESGGKKLHEKIYRGDSQAPAWPQITADVNHLVEATQTSGQATLQELQAVVSRHTDVSWVPARLKKAA